MYHRNNKFAWRFSSADRASLLQAYTAKVENLIEMSWIIVLYCILGIVSLPGDSVQLTGPRGYKPMQQQQKTALKPLEIIVYFMDKTGINLTVEDGQHAEAGRSDD